MSRESEFEDLIIDNEPEIQVLARAARELIDSVRPDARQQVETSWGGYLLFKQPSDGGNTVCWVSAHKKHVSIGFAQGAELTDPGGLLQGKGKLQRHVKIKKPGDLEKAEVRELVDQAWSRQPDTETLDGAVERLREICLALPSVTETISHGHPTFRAGKKSFAIYGIYSPSVAFKATLTLLAEADHDDRLFPTPYMGHKGWLSLRVDKDTDWDEVAQFVRDSYTQVATKKMQQALAD